MTSETTSTESLFLGLDGSTGGYLVAPQPEELASLALADQLPGPHLADVRARLQRKRPSLGVVDAVEDVTDLSQTGWGVVFASHLQQEARDSLRELLALRREQASGQNPNHFREYAYYPGETKQSFLSRLHVAPSGAVDPAEMPYYLLLVGSPEDIPFSFQFQLDVQYAVGRIYFDSAQEYAAYAASVVAAERVPAERRATFFAVQNEDDIPTRLSATKLVSPLAERIAATQAKESRWTVETIKGGDAMKARLAQLLGGGSSPQLLFTASHGIGFPPDHPRQRADQGALVCQNWPGPKRWGREIPRDFYFSADDIGSQGCPGLIAVAFACFGAGTPKLEDYAETARSPVVARFGQRLSRTLAREAFVARLPQRLLTHPRGGALAFVGHVERAHGSSFLWDATDGTSRSNIRPFDALVSRLMRGMPVGAALEPLNERYAELCADLAHQREEIEQSARAPDLGLLAGLWMASNDARGYVIFGDPAARLNVQRAHSREEVIVTSNDSVAAVDTERPVAHVTTSAPASQVETVAPASTSVGDRSTVRVEVDTQSGRLTVTTTRDNAVVNEASDTDASYLSFGGDAAKPLADLKATLTHSMQAAADQLAGAIGHLARDVATLQVVTYSSEDLDAVDFDDSTGGFVGPARRRAMTRVRLDGQTTAIVPERDGTVEHEFWAVHCQLVEQAQSQRAKLLESAVAGVAGLLGVLKTL
jgi:hypothetical protein